MKHWLTLTRTQAHIQAITSVYVSLSAYITHKHIRRFFFFLFSENMQAHLMWLLLTIILIIRYFQDKQMQLSRKTSSMHRWLCTFASKKIIRLSVIYFDAKWHIVWVWIKHTYTHSLTHSLAMFSIHSNFTNNIANLFTVRQPNWWLASQRKQCHTVLPC